MIKGTDNSLTQKNEPLADTLEKPKEAYSQSDQPWGTVSKA